jgi:hypothetical protein
VRNVGKKSLDRGKFDAEVRTKLLEVASVMADLKTEDIEALEKYDAAITMDESDLPAEEKAEKWKMLATELPGYAAFAGERAALWGQAVQKQRADNEVRVRRISARDNDWSKLFRLLPLTTMTEQEKRKWVEEFVGAYSESPGLESWMAERVVKFIPAGVKRKQVESIAKRPATKSALYPAEVDGKFGYVDRRGRFVIPPRFDRAENFSEGLAAVSVRDHRDCGRSWEAGNMECLRASNPVGYIDETGEMQIEPRFGYGADFKGGLAVVSMPDGKWGFIDRVGRVLGQIQFDGARQFSEGYAAVQMGGSKSSIGSWNGGKWGYVDERGEIVLEPQFEEAHNYIGGLAAVETDTGWSCIDYKGHPVQAKASGGVVSPICYRSPKIPERNGR